MTEGDEMKISAPVKAPQGIAHKRKAAAGEVKTRTLEKHKDAAPTCTLPTHKGSRANDILAQWLRGRAEVRKISLPPAGMATQIARIRALESAFGRQ